MTLGYPGSLLMLYIFGIVFLPPIIIALVVIWMIGRGRVGFGRSFVILLLFLMASTVLWWLLLGRDASGLPGEVPALTLNGAVVAFLTACLRQGWHAWRSGLRGR